MSISEAYRKGWNAWLDSASQDDNPWTECSDSGHEWVRGHIDAEKKSDAVGADQVERFAVDEHEAVLGGNPQGVAEEMTRDEISRMMKEVWEASGALGDRPTIAEALESFVRARAREEKERSEDSKK